MASTRSSLPDAPGFRFAASFARIAIGNGLESLEGKVVLVTGGSRRIGRVVALALADAGADVAVIYRAREAQAEEVRARVEVAGRRCVAVRADVSSPAEVALVVGIVQRALGPVAVLVNNAGVVVMLVRNGFATVQTVNVNGGLYLA